MKVSTYLLPLVAHLVRLWSRLDGRLAGLGAGPGATDSEDNF